MPKIKKTEEQKLTNLVNLERIHYLRCKKHISQEGIALNLKIGRQCYIAKEFGYTPFTATELVHVAKMLETTLEDLIMEE